MVPGKDLSNVSLSSNKNLQIYVHRHIDLAICLIFSMKAGAMSTLFSALYSVPITLPGTYRHNRYFMNERINEPISE